MGPNEVQVPKGGGKNIDLEYYQHPSWVFKVLSAPLQGREYSGHVENNAQT